MSFVTEKPLVYNHVSFVLGIDSVTNVSGALGGDLDPTTGMYWTWQSGYINVKVEGRSNSCKTRNNEFQFHLGGYMFPNAAAQTILLDAKPNSNLTMIVDLKPWFEQIKLSEQNHIMSPSLEAVRLSDLLKQNINIR
ncbi:MAG: hypothetical protein HYZ42_18620 [Bacteroidetes bacterium]|nr:hypothetical protein [Bacteroidota bacterium]